MTARWDESGPMPLDPVVEQWGTGGHAQRSDWIPDDTPVFKPPPEPEPEPELPPEPEPASEVDWARVLLWAFVLMIAAAAVGGFMLASWVIHELGAHPHPHGTWQSRRSTGTVFAWLVIGTGVVLLARFVTSSFRR